ncbi:unnamed protein product [Rangifer tarandus platyrhynchus]|uniref:Uncharacterized protein n=1 Tax=Rangifer tarandus platyrhynchus TaxID=3082113 RepID=A0ABN8ZDK1_RANTA|nr:unnamed protein product [Rangifer tarandus platyrhynchus]
MGDREGPSVLLQLRPLLPTRGLFPSLKGGKGVDSGRENPAGSPRPTKSRPPEGVFHPVAEAGPLEPWVGGDLPSREDASCWPWPARSGHREEGAVLMSSRAGFGLTLHLLSAFTPNQRQLGKS